MSSPETTGCPYCERELERRAAEMQRLRGALARVMQTLTVPAAEYVPAIPDAWEIIREALRDG